MSFAGLKKQLNKANQYLSEQMGTAAATALDDDYMELERKTDVMGGLVDDLINRTREYLLPNPATRMKLATSAYVGKIRGGSSGAGGGGGGSQSVTGGSTGSGGPGKPYSLPEGDLGDAMCQAAVNLGDRGVLSKTLADVGDSMRQLADIKYNLDENVKHNFIDPLSHLQNKDVKEVMHHRKKLQGRRLDYDCKKRNHKTPMGELAVAGEKLQESKQLAEMAMHNLLDNDVEHVCQLNTLVSAQLDYHRQAAELLQRVQTQLNARVSEARSQPRAEHRPRPLALPDATGRSNGDYGGHQQHHNDVDAGAQRGGASSGKAPPPSWNEPPKPIAAPAGANTNNNGDFTSQALYPAANSSSSSTAAPWNNVQDPWEVGGGAAAQPPSYQQVGGSRPSAVAQYDFEPENPGELRLRDGETVYLIMKIDDNWYEGRTESGASGYFPVSYVKVAVPLP